MAAYCSYSPASPAQEQGCVDLTKVSSRSSSVGSRRARPRRSRHSCISPPARRRDQCQRRAPRGRQILDPSARTYRGPALPSRYHPRVSAVDGAFWKRRWEAFLDNLIFWGFLLAAGIVVAATAAFGTRDAALPLWLVVLFGVVQIGTVGALVVLFRRTRPSQATAEPVGASPSHPHAGLLARAAALEASLAALDPGIAPEASTADAFNRILRDAKAATDDEALWSLTEYKVERGKRYSHDGSPGGSVPSWGRSRRSSGTLANKPPGRPPESPRSFTPRADAPGGAPGSMPT